MICFQRNGGTPVPGCSGNDGSRTDYCIRRSDIGQQPQPTPTNPKPVPSPVPAPVPKPTTPTGGGGGGKGLSLHFVGINPPPSALPLGECEGDCDNDDEVRKKRVVWRDYSSSVPRLHKKKSSQLSFHFFPCFTCIVW